MSDDVQHTTRGFAFVEFTDRYGAKCSLQKSSLAFEECVWFGVDMSSVAPKRLGSNGWEPVAVPEATDFYTRMHLTQDMVRDLLPLLTRFVESGRLEPIMCRECGGVVTNYHDEAECPPCGVA